MALRFWLVRQNLTFCFCESRQWRQTFLGSVTCVSAGCLAPGWLGYGAITEDPPTWLRDWLGIPLTKFSDCGFPKTRFHTVISAHKNECRSSCKVPVIVVQYQPKIDVSTNFGIIPKNKFHGNPFGRSRVVTCVQTDGWSEFNRGCAELRTCLTIHPSADVLLFQMLLSVQNWRH
jgi:hypothetical protein